MSLLDNIRSKPRAAKIRIMWIVAIIVAVLLMVVWVISGHFHKKTQADTTLFQTIGTGVSNVKENYGK